MTRDIIRDLIKGLILRSINAYCGAAAVHDGAAVHESLFHVYCGGCRLPPFTHGGIAALGDLKTGISNPVRDSSQKIVFLY